ncbi:50S ribosomal protein L11 methyltransferase [Campylobacter sp. US33a]|uniref:50S ribosomal protein L11 methyltransferase n=1 Tax=Campylobacter sp. US33a TaxID=2498120 RepID=UPI0010672045|nr:50S ribosomal protein L11 methyltransferase [Campylobacter sp. US33a]TEY04662.1 50S ribosomal protein L11 methyltransferase [Campylobacter sp. US33a]
MQSYYNELFFKVDIGFLPFFVDVVFDLGIEAIEEKDGGIYVRSDESLEDLFWALNCLKEKLEIQKSQKISFDIKLEQKENKDWIEEYKKGVNPIQIDNFYIHTTWQEPKQNLINIQIDPALAFGSGHHESTHSCIKLLQKYAKKDMQVLDLGCGSGILSIVLAKLGLKVDACDTDELAISSTLSNAKLNHLSLNHSWIGSIDKATIKYDFIVANIIADVILILEKDLKNSLKDGAYLILSGILDKYEERVKDKFKDLKLVESLKVNEWLSLVYKKEGNE